MLRYKTETRPGLVALYDIRLGNGAGQFLQPRSPHGAGVLVQILVMLMSNVELMDRFRHVGVTTYLLTDNYCWCRHNHSRFSSPVLTHANHHHHSHHFNQLPLLSFQSLYSDFSQQNLLTPIKLHGWRPFLPLSF